MAKPENDFLAKYGDTADKHPNKDAWTFWEVQDPITLTWSVLTAHPNFNDPSIGTLQFRLIPQVKKLAGLTYPFPCTDASLNVPTNDQFYWVADLCYPNEPRKFCFDDDAQEFNKSNMDANLIQLTKEGAISQALAILEALK